MVLPDTPQPALLRDIIEWDVGNWARCLPYWREWIPSNGVEPLRVLAVGERNGGMSLWFARMGCRVVCTDVDGPTPLAKEIHQRHGVTDRIEYAAASLMGLPYEADSFDIVACKSVIGGVKGIRKVRSSRTLENHGLAVEEARRVLRPGGLFLGAENLRGNVLHQWVRLRRHRGNLGWRHMSPVELDWLLREFSEREVKPFGFIGAGNGEGRWNRWRGKMEEWLSRCLPRDWLYIGFFRARK
ncbi:MAG: class I SAM-dependent methyltransferase [Verrucomicrobiae bacterium]|nr:class I SAM-dependent methyltransferase [Verrucomicrobiae bacterium]